VVSFTTWLIYRWGTSILFRLSRSQYESLFSGNSITLIMKVTAVVVVVPHDGNTNDENWVHLSGA
jgi:hypothetical protein